VIRIGVGGRTFRLWIPLIFLWIVLMPFAVLALPLFFLYCLIGRVSLVRAARTTREIFGGLAGTRVEFEDRRHHISLHIA
jgi:hypothetical protein